MMETELSRAKNDNGFGYQTAEQWQKLHDLLLQYNAIPKAVDVKTAFIADLPLSLLKAGKVVWP
jgi:hypothetical protein